MAGHRKDATPYYHLISRCVRRQFLCGLDALTGRDFSHRRGWIVDRIHLLGEVFAVDLCAYAVMSNHFHLVVRVDAERATGWSDAEVVERWERLFTGSPLARRLASGNELTPSQAEQAAARIATWRSRLADLSWFMRCLNEPIARWANREDDCTGRFWEGRFKSQALLDEAAVLTAMAYVDLNPIRAGIATSPEESDFTSIQERIRAWQGNRKTATSSECLEDTMGRLLGISDSDKTDRVPLPITFPDYLELVEWSERAVAAGKRGAIPQTFHPFWIGSESVRKAMSATFAARLKDSSEFWAGFNSSTPMRLIWTFGSSRARASPGWCLAKAANSFQLPKQ